MTSEQTANKVTPPKPPSLNPTKKNSERNYSDANQTIQSQTRTEAAYHFLINRP